MPSSGNLCLFWKTRKGPPSPAFSRLGKTIPFAMQLNGRHKSVVGLLPITVAESRAGLLLVGYQLLRAGKSTQTTQNKEFPGRGRKTRECSCQLRILPHTKTNPGLRKPWKFEAKQWRWQRWGPSGSLHSFLLLHFAGISLPGGQHQIVID